MNPQHIADTQQGQIVQEQTKSNVLQFSLEPPKEQEQEDICGGGVCQVNWKPFRAGIPTG